MPVIITKNNIDYYLVPAPLVSFSRSTLNNIGRPGLGNEYSVSLQGTLIQTHGNPYYSSGVAGISTSSWTTTSAVESAEVTTVSSDDLLDATIKKQEKIRSLFTNPVISGVATPIKVKIKGWDTNYDGNGLEFNAFVDEVSFDSEGMWANPNTYTVSLKTSNFTNPANSGEFSTSSNESSPTYGISSLSESFDIQEDQQRSLTFNGSNQFVNTKKVYSVSRSISAVGTPVYDSSGSYVSGQAPWQQASGYIYQYMGLGYSQLPQTRSSVISLIGSGYSAANVVYQESISREDGSYSINESYLLYPGNSPVIETITINEDISDSDISSISVQGTIQGLNTLNGFLTSGNAYVNANTYWSTVSTGVPPMAYQYAAANTSLPWVHPKPLTMSVGRDFGAGTINYSYSFDNRPPNIIPGSISESISINDTYPGEIFSVTPVIGRSQPVLQYLNSRSEYKRSLSINVTMGKTTPNWNTTLGAASGVNTSGVLSTGVARDIVRSWLISDKPSVSHAPEFDLIYQAANPVNDPTFTVVSGKCFHSAPNETWDARTRNYSYNVEWTYTRG